MENKWTARACAVFLSAVLCLGLLPAASGSAGASGPQRYDDAAHSGASLRAGPGQIQGTCGAYGSNVSWSLELDTGILTITGTGPLQDYTPGNAPWNLYLDRITQVSIGSGITNVGQRMFQGAAALRKLTLADTITEIGMSAFLGCTALTDISFGTGIRTLGPGAFLECTSLRQITIPVTVKLVDQSCFLGCGSLTKVTVLGADTVLEPWAVGYDEDAQEQAVPIPGFVLEGWTGSATEAYAKDNNMTFASLGVLPDPDPTEPTDPTDPAEPEPPRNPFVDVPSYAYYTAPVLWAVDHAITAGTDKTHFSPNDTCTRTQVVTFLWRAAGNPEPKTGNNPFQDVKPSDYFYKPVLWAVENKITAGTGTTTFSPNDGCTRGQVVTFLWRSAGNPAPGSSKNPFTDVKSDAYFYTPVLWAVEHKITAGTSDTTFSPNDTCTRAQIVTFLYRDLAE